MAINITNYVNITSGVGAGTVVPNRELVPRLFTGNVLVPPGTFVSFSDIASVESYFGTGSEEYARASFALSWVSKNQTQVGSIQFARWVDVAVPPMIFALQGNATSVADWTPISSGSFILTMGDYTFTISGLDFTTVGSLADVATIIQDAIQAESGGGALWTSATVTYDSGSGGFDLVGGATGDAVISVTAGGGGTDITPAGLLGWLPQSINTNGSITPGAIWANGSAVETITDLLTESSDLSTNFGSFGFLTNLNLTLDQVIEAATWNYGQNNLYLYSVPVIPADAVTWQTALENLGGVGITISPVLDPIEFPEMAPMMIEAATDYTTLNAVQNYMFQIFNLTPSVSDTATANAYNALNINYYGVTQTAGVQFAFYQTGVLQGPSTSPKFMGAYVNEIWLKDTASATLLQLQLNLAQIPANVQGEITIINTLQGVIQQALNNGTISVGKTLTTSQQMYITSVTGDPTAWHQVQDIGYWLNVQIVLVGLIYQAQYVLVYSKNDTINYIEGIHNLI